MTSYLTGCLRLAGCAVLLLAAVWLLVLFLALGMPR